MGQRRILPSSFAGSERHMNQLFQDSMAICRRFHKPDIFLTMTANPKWPEITQNLFPGQTASDRPDIVSRVFELKKRAILKEINRGLFGGVAARVHSKRGVFLICTSLSSSKMKTTSEMSTILTLWYLPNSLILILSLSSISLSLPSCCIVHVVLSFLGQGVW